MSGFLQSEVSFSLFFCLLSLIVVLAPLRIGFIFRMFGGIVFVSAFYFLMMAIPEIYGRPRPLESMVQVAKDMWVDGFITDKEGVLGQGPSIYLWGRKNAEASEAPINHKNSDNEYSLGKMISKIEN